MAGIGLAVFSSLCFGASGSLGKSLIDGGLTPLQAVWLRMGGAALVMLPVALALRGGAGLAAARRHWAALAAYGVTGVAGCQALYFVAASRLPVGIAILLEFTGPVLVLAWTRLVWRVPVHRSALAGVGVALAGLAVVVQVWSGLSLDAVGLLAGLGAAACQAAYFLLVERMAGVDPLVMTAAGSAVGTVLLAALAAPWALPWGRLGAPVRLAGHSVPAWLPALWLVGVSTVVAYLTGVAAVQRLSATLAGAICYTEAVAAPLLAWILLGQGLTGVQIAGGLVVLAGAYLAQRSVPAPPQAGRPAGVTAAGPDAETGGPGPVSSLLARRE
jgi:drug/metabolite transporter (DMT)-like permease